MLDSTRQFKAVGKTLGDLQADAAGMVIAAAADIALVLDRDGNVLDHAFGNSDLGLDNGDDWLGRPWADLVTADSAVKIEELLADARAEKPGRWRQVNHPAGTTSIPVQYLAMVLKDSNRIIVLGRDMRSLSMLQQRLIESQQAMERDYARYRHAETRYRQLFQLASEAVLVVDARSRQIVEANKAAGRLLADNTASLIGRPFPMRFDAEGLNRLDGMLDSVKASGEADDVTVRLLETETDFMVTASLFVEDLKRFFLIRLRPVNEEANGGPLPRRKSRMLDIVDQMADGFVITDQNGVIQSANPAFVAMAQMATEQQLFGHSLERWFSEPGIALSALITNLRQQRTVHLFATRMRGEYGEVAEVEISAVLIERGEDVCIGFLIRPIGRRLTPAQPKSGDLEGAVRHMADLVGRVSLKEIVRETTDVIEQLCIESALDLCNGNRASAAEMLGLSRQSLYVKMRRFGVGGVETPSEEPEEA